MSESGTPEAMRCARCGQPVVETTDHAVACPSESGTPEAISDRFWQRVEKTDTCWLWTAGKTQDGYGRFDKRMAHRWAYENCVGPIPEGLELDHLCRVRACVNPAHLEAVTRSENQRRSPISAGGRNAAKTHCPQGHEYTEANTRIDAEGARRCRTCAVLGRDKHREEMRVWRAKKRAEVSQ